MTNADMLKIASGNAGSIKMNGNPTATRTGEGDC